MPTIQEFKPVKDQVWKGLVLRSHATSLPLLNTFSSVLLSLGAIDQLTCSVNNKFAIFWGLMIVSYCAGSHWSAKFIDQLQVDEESTFKKFQQDDFAKEIATKYSFVKFNSGGNCVGHIHMWYESFLQNRDYLSTLERIKKTNNPNQLEPSQLNLLKNIRAIQAYRSFIFHGTSNRINDATFFKPMRQSIINEILTKIIANPQKLFVLSMNGKLEKTGHIIGIVMSQEGHIKIFDPNFGEIEFNNKTNALIYLSRLLASAYFNLPNIGLLSRDDLDKTNEPPLNPIIKKFK